MANPVRIVDARAQGTGSNEGVMVINNSLRVIEHYPDGLMKTYEDTSFVAGDSPATHNFYSDTDRVSVDGYLICDGPGSIQVDYSQDGISFSDKATLRSGESFNLRSLGIKKIRITHTGSDSSYRVVLV